VRRAVFERISREELAEAIARIDNLAQRTGSKPPPFEHGACMGSSISRMSGWWIPWAWRDFLKIRPSNRAKLGSSWQNP
jgi:hypothetical protein